MDSGENGSLARQKQEFALVVTKIREKWTTGSSLQAQNTNAWISGVLK